MVWCDTTRIKKFKGPLKSEGDLHAKDRGQGKWIADVAPGLYGRSARVEFSPTQHVYAKTAVLVEVMRASSQEMPKHRRAPVRIGESGARDVRTLSYRKAQRWMH